MWAGCQENAEGAVTTIGKLWGNIANGRRGDTDTRHIDRAGSDNRGPARTRAGETDRATADAPRRIISELTPGQPKMSELRQKDAHRIPNTTKRGISLVAGCEMFQNANLALRA